MKSFIFFTAICCLVLSACDTAKDQKQQKSISSSTSGMNIGRILDSAEKGYPYEIVRALLNSDNVLDYFIIERSGISIGFFFDGKTGKEIHVDGVNDPWSRPGVDLEYKVIDLVCDDPQKEVLVKGGSGGTVGLTLTTKIYRFDSASGKMKLVFEKDEFNSHFDEKGNEITDDTDYIELVYNKDTCNIEILTGKGVYRDGEITPLKKRKKIYYRFNALENRFEESEP